MNTMKNFKSNMLLLRVTLFYSTLVAPETPRGMTTSYMVTLDCKSCVKKMENHLGPMRGIKKVKCSLENQTVQITYSTKRWDNEKIVAQFKKLELDAKPAVVTDAQQAKKSCCPGH